MGGSFQKIVLMPDITQADLIVYADVAGEVEKVCQDNNNKVTPLILGKGETIATLCAKRKEALNIKDFFDKLPSIDLSHGMGAWPILGRESTRILDEGYNGNNGELSDIMRERIFNPVFKANDGTLSAVDIISLSSLSGGSGGGAGYILPQRVLEMFAQKSNASLAMRRFCLGAITFTGLGDNIFLNAGMRLREYLTHLLANNRHPRENRSMVLVEFPPLGNDKEARDTLTMQLVQVYFDPAFAQVVDIGDTNKSATFDGVRVLGVKWWNAISPRLTAAFRYVNDMEDLIKALKPDLKVCLEIKYEVLESGGVWSSSNLRDYFQTYHKVPTIEEARGNLLFNVKIIVVFAPGDEKLLMMHTLMKPVRIPQTLQEFQQIMEQYIGLRDRIKARLDEANKEFAEANDKLEILSRQLDNIIAGYSTVANTTTEKKKKPWWIRLWEWLTGKSKVQNIATGSSNIMQEFLDQVYVYCKYAAIVNALQGAWDTVVINLNHYQDRFRRLEKALRDIKGDKSEEGLTYVDFKPFAEMFPGMLELSEAGRNEQLKVMLDDSVKYITLRGLGAVAGLAKEDSEIVKICSTLLSGKPRYVSPGWGGEELDPENLRIDVLTMPPMSEDLQDEVRATMARLKATPIIVFGSKNCGGVNVLQIGVYRVTRKGQIITPLYTDAIKEALQKNRGIYALPDIPVEE